MFRAIFMSLVTLAAISRLSPILAADFQVNSNVELKGQFPLCELCPLEIC